MEMGPTLPANIPSLRLLDTTLRDTAILVWQPKPKIEMPSPFERTATLSTVMTPASPHPPAGSSTKMPRPTPNPEMLPFVTETLVKVTSIEGRTKTPVPPGASDGMAVQIDADVAPFDQESVPWTRPDVLVENDALGQNTATAQYRFRLGRAGEDCDAGEYTEKTERHDSHEQPFRQALLPIEEATLLGIQESGYWLNGWFLEYWAHSSWRIRAYMHHRRSVAKGI